MEYSHTIRPKNARTQKQHWFGAAILFINIYDYTQKLEKHIYEIDETIVKYEPELS